MKKALTRNDKELYYYNNGVKKIIDPNNKATYPSDLSGVISGDLYGDISDLRGVISSDLRGVISGGVYGDISGVYGVISGDLYGDITGVYGPATSCIGDIDICELTEEERKNGVNIDDLIK